MPIYEYVCATCGTESEVMHKLSEAPGNCPACEAPALTKLVSAAGFRLGGGGWYETDFKSANKRNLAGAPASGDAGGCSPAGCDKPACAAKAEASA